MFPDLAIDLSNLAVGWSEKDTNKCADCGKDLNVEEEVPLRLFHEKQNRVFGLSFHWACAEKRMSPVIGGVE